MSEVMEIIEWLDATGTEIVHRYPPEGSAAAAMGAGLGAGVGMMIPGMMYNVLAGDGVSAETLLRRGLVNCPDCHGQVSIDSRFCSHCGHQLVVVRKCPKCAENVTAAAKFCPSCGGDLQEELACRLCDTKLPPGTKFCLNCGERVATD